MDIKCKHEELVKDHEKRMRIVEVQSVRFEQILENIQEKIDDIKTTIDKIVVKIDTPSEQPKQQVSADFREKAILELIKVVGIAVAIIAGILGVKYF